MSRNFKIIHHSIETQLADSFSEHLRWSDLISAHFRLTSIGVTWITILSVTTALVGAAVVQSESHIKVREGLQSSTPVIVFEDPEISSVTDQKNTSTQPQTQVLDSFHLGLWLDQNLHLLNLDDSQVTSQHLRYRGQIQRFELTGSEFILRAPIPPRWKPEALGMENVIRFQSPHERDESLSYHAGCFGPCDHLETNIRRSLSARARRDHRRGLDSRLITRRVHHPTWIEYVVLYEGISEVRGEGRELLETHLLGVSIRWEADWLNALRCEYYTPFSVSSLQDAEILKVWTDWREEFLSTCHEYQVLSWE